MSQRPSALSLMLCDQVLFERDTLKPTLVGVFTGIACKSFPSLPHPIDVFVVLTDGVGRVMLELVVSFLDSEEAQQINSQRMALTFANPLQVINLRFRFRQLSFPAAGTYLFELLVDEEPLCHRRVRVYQSEESS
jgi:hypothetical protein